MGAGADTATITLEWPRGLDGGNGVEAGAGLRAALVVSLRNDRWPRPERAVRDVQLRPGRPQGHLECHREREVPSGFTDAGKPDRPALGSAVRAARAAAEVQQRGHAVRGQGMPKLGGIREFAQGHRHAAAPVGPYRPGREAHARTGCPERVRGPVVPG